MPIEINAIETRRFGITAAKVIDHHASTDAIDMAALAQKVEMLTVRIPTNDLRRVHALEGNGYRLMDTLVYYDRDLANFDLTEDPMIRPATPADADDVTDVAHLSFAEYIGHYHADPRLSDTSADAAYVEWAQNSIKACGPGSPAFVATRDGRVVGFITLRLNSRTETELVLAGVHPDAQGKGLYGRLFASGMTGAKALGSEKIVTSTQVNNIPVQKVWSSLGLRMARSYYTLHKWF